MTKFRILIRCQSDDSIAQFFEVYGRTGAEQYDRVINETLDHEVFYTELVAWNVSISCDSISLLAQ